MKKLILLIVCLSFVYTQCNETNWQEYAPNLIDCTFTDADLSNNDFSNMYFFNTMFIDSDFSNSSFLDSYFEKTYAINSDFSSSDFSNAQQGTQEAIFINCNLSGANFEGYYEYLYLLFSDINSANFENVYFLACEFIGSNFKNANFEYIEDSMFGWNNNIINNLKKFGIKICPTAIKGQNTNNTNLFFLKRYMVGFKGINFPFKNYK